MSNYIRKGVVPILASRRAVQKLTPKFPKFLKENTTKQAKKDDPGWPDYMRRAGYAVIAIAVPYSMMAIIAESPRLRAGLEGDPGAEDSDTIGRKVVDFVRWYFGKEDDIPYFEYLEIDKDDELSLFSDISTTKRKEQEMIQQRLRDELKVHIETEAVGDEKTGLVDGRKIADIAKVMEELGVSNTGQQLNRVYITFEDAPETEEEYGINYFEDNKDVDYMQNISNLTSIWSAWFHFPSPSELDAQVQTTASNSSGKRTPHDSYQPLIVNLTHKIDDLQKDLKDPNSFRDRDDMESEIKQMRKEITSLKRERRYNKLKSFVSSSS
jgi:hypothetical protein